MEARKAGRPGQTPSAESAEPAPAAVSAPPWYRRVAFWRAIAGMTFALAIACAIVAAEFSSALIERSRHYHRRLRQLSSNIAAMRGKIADADREIAGMRTAAEVDDGLRRIIAAPDSRLIRLEAIGRASAPNGVIAFSPGLRRAAIEIGGLPVVSGGSAYTIWWECGKRGPLKAARIGLGATDKAALVIAMPSASEIIEGAIVTTDSQAASAKPSGDIVLKGAVVHTPSIWRR
ncbi:MAG: hypothetical protein ABSC63_07235 [Candidatus Binataceae bacterium]